MKTLAQSYRENAAKAEAEASATQLANVRDRHLRSAHAWHEMAERQDSTDRARAARELKTEPAI